MGTAKHMYVYKNAAVGRQQRAIRENQIVAMFSTWTRKRRRKKKKEGGVAKRNKRKLGYLVGMQFSKACGCFGSEGSCFVGGVKVCV